MDLTLEIYGWVESLEDALTQFTAPEDLDGENMYRCGRLGIMPPIFFFSFWVFIMLFVKLSANHFRCSAYVRARKELSLHEVPNILTIVLKRFQVTICHSSLVLGLH